MLPVTNWGFCNVPTTNCGPRTSCPAGEVALLGDITIATGVVDGVVESVIGVVDVVESLITMVLVSSTLPAVLLDETDNVMVDVVGVVVLMMLQLT